MTQRGAIMDIFRQLGKNFLCLLITPALLIANPAFASQIPESSTKSTINQALFSQTIQNNSIPQLIEKMKNGELSAHQLTQFFIEQINTRNSTLNAVISINPDALKSASQLDSQLKSGHLVGPLHGIPILVKDNIETKEMPTTAGSLALKDNYTQRDATLIKKLKHAGAIILGKTNLSEWANIRSERSSSGWSAIGGQTRNPYDLNRSTCGSSSGSGAAVAALLSVAAIGTETNGSITCPASATGIVGVKPTVGLVSRSGIIPISHTQDTAGPMTRSVIDAAIILSVIKGYDKADPATQLIDFNQQQNYVPSQLFTSLKGKRIGIISSGAFQHEAVKKLFDHTVILIKNAGAEIVENLDIEYYDGFYQDSYEVLLFEFKADLNQYLAQLPNQYNHLTLAKIIDFNYKNHATEMPYFEQEIFEKSQTKGSLTDKKYLAALKKIRQATRQNGLDKLLKEHKLDALISATLTPAWSIDRINGDHFTGSFSTAPAVAGYPHLTIPMGKVHHLPVGLSITASALSEKTLFNITYTIEALIESQQSVETQEPQQ